MKRPELLSVRRAARVLALVAAALAPIACGSRTGLYAEEPDAGAPSEAGVDLALCSPSNCAGCCDSEGVCRPGTDTSVCGAGGTACVACSPLHDICEPHAGDPHELGVFCWAPCDFVKTCGEGCCTPAGACLPGQSDDSCGSGTICQDCRAQGRICTPVGVERFCM